MFNEFVKEIGQAIVEKSKEYPLSFQEAALFIGSGDVFGGMFQQRVAVMSGSVGATVYAIMVAMSRDKDIADSIRSAVFMHDNDISFESLENTVKPYEGEGFCDWLKRTQGK